MSRVVSCKISGKSFTFTKEYFNKRVEEYTDIESLQKYYVTKKVKSLIQRGYSAQEIRNILNIISDDLASVDSQEIIGVMNYHNVRNETISKKNSSNFATNKSDNDVSAFINNIKDLNYD
jgi:hypothetical protein